MDLNEPIPNAEEAEEAGAGAQGPVLETPARSESATDEISAALILDERLPVGEAAQDMEELATATTMSPYSAFSGRQKKLIVMMATWAAFISPTSANIYFPALNPLQKDLGVSPTLINLTLTSYMIFQGIAPTVFGDMADMAGRRPAYILAFIIYLGANIGLALQNSYAALFILRCVQSSGSSGAIALGFGVIADVSTSSERGTYIGIVGAGTMMGPTLGPVIGGILAQFLGWRSIFWFLVILAGAFLVSYGLAVPETGRNIVGNGSVPPPRWNMTFFEWRRFSNEEKSADDISRTWTVENRRLAQAKVAQGTKIRFPNPLKTIYIIMEKDMALILFYNAIIYTIWYDIISSLPQLFQQIYGFNDLQIGLCYIPFGAGCAVNSFINGKILDWNYKKVARKVGFIIDRERGDDLRHFPIEKARLDVIWPLLGLGLTSVLCYGWALEKNAPLAIPLTLHFFMGLFINGSFNILSTLIVDLYPQSPSTATAANNLVRCIWGAAGTGVIDIMIDKMGRGWCFSFLVLLCAAAMPMLWIELKFGPRWREERCVRLEKQEREKLRRREVEQSDLQRADNEREMKA